MVRYPFQRTNVLNLFFRIEENSTSIPLEEINTSSSNSSALGRPFVSNFPHPRNRQWSNAQGHLGEDVEALNWLRLYLLQNKLSLRSIFVESSSLPNQGSCHLILSVSHLSQSTSHFKGQVLLNHPTPPFFKICVTIYSFSKCGLHFYECVIENLCLPSPTSTIVEVVDF